MNSTKKNSKELENKIDGVIEKSNAQKKILKKILNHFNKQKDDTDDNDKENLK